MVQGGTSVDFNFEFLIKSYFVMDNVYIFRINCENFVDQFGK